MLNYSHQISLFPKNYNKILHKRFYTNKSVRVRFAPSPTGFLHLGGLRTALYNYLFAKSHNGLTILRIEDTDQSRIVNSATENLIKDLSWCGIEFDEGPYFQSKRCEIYKKYVNQLLEEKKAYYCFCSKIRLELLRKEALKLGEIPKYDNCCRNLTKREISENIQKGIVPCVRFKLSEYSEPVPDLIFSSINHKVHIAEGDPVIFKADGFPTYHLANVIDDHLMNITHVLRGVEWQISTLKHILLYKAFNWNPPAFGHIPLLLNKDGSKLSKRHGDTVVQDLRKTGYLPNAVLNFIVKYGGGFNIQPSEKNLKIYKMEELIEKFDLQKISNTSSKVLLSDLKHFNSLEIKRLLTTEDGTSTLVVLLKEIIENHIKKNEIQRQPVLNSDYLKLILNKMKNRIIKLEDLVSSDLACFWFWEGNTNIAEKDYVTLLKKFVKDVNEIEWTLEEIKIFIKQFVSKNNVDLAKLMKLLRLILIEQKVGPSVAEILEILGKETVNYRLKYVIDKSKRNTSLE